METAKRVVWKSIRRWYAACTNLFSWHAKFLEFRLENTRIFNVYLIIIRGSLWSREDRIERGLFRDNINSWYLKRKRVNRSASIELPRRIKSESSRSRLFTLYLYTSLMESRVGGGIVRESLLHLAFAGSSWTDGWFFQHSEFSWHHVRNVCFIYFCPPSPFFPRIDHNGII